ncbi:MAG: ATP-binding protein [Verrucomicrobia bacterium]|nr:ATP-binding protein [Verrucomicrobiota bacterium]
MQANEDIPPLDQTEAPPPLEKPLRQTRKMEAMGQFAGGVAHDFTNYLTVIQGHSALLLEEENLPPETRQALTEIYMAGERASTLLRQLLVCSGRHEMHRQTLDLNEMIRDTAKWLRHLAGEDVALQLDCASGLPPISADPVLLEQVLVNLTVNAREALPKGGQLHIRTTRVVLDGNCARRNPQARPGEFVCLSVRDTGSGIAADIMPRIFDPFFTTKAPGQGTGLGLAAVSGIVKQHAGWVEVESPPGQGTTFHVLFPALPPRPVEISQPAAFTKLSRGAETILLVEDEAPLRELAVQVLHRCGYRVLEAASGVEALQVWGRHRPRIQLLLTDLVLPDDLTGCELAEKLRAEKPGLTVIYSSCYTPEMMDGVFPTKGTIHFLRKPYHPQQLTEMVRQALDETNQETHR